MATVTWRHLIVITNSEGIAWLDVANINPLQFGGYAEGADASTGTHDSCTPTQGNTGHESGLSPLAATSTRIDSNGDLRASVGFAAAPGARLRAHVWDVT
jgi:hypothetical protein